MKSRACLFFTLGTMLLSGLVPPALAEVIVPGVASSQLDPELKGLVRVEELNCAAYLVEHLPPGPR